MSAELPTLEERLALLDAAPNEEGRRGAQVRVAELVPVPARSHRRRWLLGIGAAALLALTPPGQSLADAVVELVGIGDEPTGGPQFVNPGSTRQDSVIGAGQTLSGQPFELVETDPDKPAPGPGPEMDATCVYTNFPEQERPQSSVAQCVNAGVLRKLAEGSAIHTVITTVPGGEGVDVEPIVNAYATGDIASLSLAIDGEETPMTSGLFQPVSEREPVTLRYGAGFVPPESLDLARLQELADDHEASVSNGQFPAVLEEGSPESLEVAELLGGIEVVGYGEDGSEVLRKQVVGDARSGFAFLIGLSREVLRERGG